MEDNEKTILRDKLAADRTVLANQRTLLSFLRTALMLFATGITLLHLFADDLILKIIGLLLIPFSVLTACIGIINYIIMKRKLNRIKNH